MASKRLTNLDPPTPAEIIALAIGVLFIGMLISALVASVVAIAVMVAWNAFFAASVTSVGTIGYWTAFAATFVLLFAINLLRNNPSNIRIS